MRVVLDTNVIIAPFLSPKGVPALILKMWEGEAFDIVVTEAILTEYQRVLSYKEIAAKHNMDESIVTSVMDHFRKYVIMAVPKRVPKVVKEDPDDDQLFAAALAGEAQYIVTKNKHVLKVGEYKDIQVLTPIAFLTLLEVERE